MVDGELTPSECAVLIVLMAEAREMSNVELNERYRFTLTGQSRVKLNSLHYVESRRVGRGYVHQLGDKGWARVHETLDFDTPRARVLGAALSALHGNLLSRVLKGGRFADMFRHNGAEPPADIEARIRTAYTTLAGEPRAWVKLASLRQVLADVSGQDLDEALRTLNRTPDVAIVPESNQKTLTEADRKAAIRIGGQDRHLLSIGVR